jgi:hypothetical protein
MTFSSVGHGSSQMSKRFLRSCGPIKPYCDSIEAVGVPLGAGDGFRMT